MELIKLNKSKMNFVAENPKATITACIGIVVFVLKMLLKDSFSPELESWLNVILPTVFGALLARYTRISKSEAIVLETSATKKAVALEDLKDKNQVEEN